MIRKRLLHPLSWFCALSVVGGVVDLVDGPVVEGDPVLGGAPGGEVGVDDEEPGDHHQLEEEGQEREEEAGDRLANRARSLFNQGDGNSDPLPEEDEETDDDEEDDADHRGEREPSISLLQEIVHYFWSPVQLEDVFVRLRVG